MGETRKCFVLINTLLKILASYPVSENDNKINFRWYSFRTFCSLFSILVALVSFVLSISEHYMGYLILAHDVSGMAIQLSFLIMAKHWSELGKECDKIDFCMGNYGFPKRLKLKLRIICIMFAITASTMYLAFDFNVVLKHKSIMGILTVDLESMRQNAHFINILNILLMTIRKISHWQIVVLRSLVDAYIITVSMVLAARLRQVAQRIDLLIKKKINNEEAWMQTREDYQRVCAFIEKWDKILGYTVLSSFTSNIYILLLQLQAIFSISSTDTQHTLIMVSCSYTLLRCIMVCYTAGNVYSEGTRLMEFVVLTPPEVYNAEIDRIIVQLRQARPALTGKQLFTLRHSLIVQVLGGIASHEIILLQYSNTLTSAN